MTINELALSSHQNAKDKGFYDDITDILANPHICDQHKEFIKSLWLGNRLMLITSELAEALEGVRHRNMSSEPKSGGFGEELADAQIRLADLAADVNLDLEKAVVDKAEYNRSRGYKHGGKVT